MKQYSISLVFLTVLGYFTGMTQTITTQKGLTTAVFNLPAGNIKVNLPEDLMRGDQISGSIQLLPQGKDARQMNKNLDLLKKYIVEFNGSRFPASQSGKIMTCTLSNDNIPQRPITLFNDQGILEAQANIPCPHDNKPIPINRVCKIPTHALTAAPLRITGPFDGNSSNTICSLAGREVDIIAESPRSCILQFPANASNTSNLLIQESGQQVCSGQINAVNLLVSAGKLSLIRGEKTLISVQVNGLQNLPVTALLTLENISPDIVKMLPLNKQHIFLTAANTANGLYSNSFIIESIQTGSFTVNVDLDLPGQLETNEHPGTTTLPQCLCHADCSIIKTGSGNGSVYFNVNLQSECRGNCYVASTTYKWHIGESGKDVAEIDGTDIGRSVTVKLKKSGSYTIYLSGTVTCSDGASCAFQCSLEQSNPPGNPPTTSECGLRPEWCAGPAIKVESFGFYPDEKETEKLKDFRPGQLIGISAFATDIDFLVQHCLCPEGLESKKHPFVFDEVYYDWDIKSIGNGGHGKLIKDPDPASNSVLYKLPYCYEDYPLLDIITLTIYNKQGKAKDEQVQIEFKISITINPPYYKEKVMKQYGLDIYLSKKILNIPADITCEEEMKGDCMVMPWEWQKGTAVETGNTITISTADEKGSDNMLLLHASATDKDDLVLKCFHTKNGALIAQTITDIPDPVDMTWEIVKGSGSFPLGNKGHTVLFVHNYWPREVSGRSANEVVLRCNINNSKRQYNDLAVPVTIESTIMPRQQPVAFVAVGDKNWYINATEIKIGTHPELVDAGKIAVQKYRDAGYDVHTAFECKLTDIEKEYKDPACQAVLVIGHGTEDGISMFGGKVFFVPVNINTWIAGKWGCATVNSKHPTGRELILLGCNIGEGKGEWYDRYFRLENFFGRKDWIWSDPLIYSTIINYLKKDFKPLVPRIIDP